MKKIALFNHKGGVGKTTLTVNIAGALAKMGKKVLVVDADPQCNLTSFYLDEGELDKVLGDSDSDTGGNTIWSSIRPVVKGKGDVESISLYEIGDTQNLYLAPGDVLLADYEEELPEAWTSSFARKDRGYDVTCALSDAVNLFASEMEAEIVMYDVGPNVGPLNRVVLLDCDAFITPVTADLFSLRALGTVGRSVQKWINDWNTITSIAPDSSKERILSGNTKYLGYITSAFKVHVGRRKSNPHEVWERKIGPRVKRRVEDVLTSIDPSLVPISPNKVGDVPHFQSLAPSAQENGVTIGELGPYVNSGYRPKISDANRIFMQLAKDIDSRLAKV